MKKLCFLLVCGVLMANEWKIQDDPYYKHKKSQFETLANVDRYDTVMLGDSITDEAQWDELLNSSTIQNRGISGDTTSGVLDRLDSTNKNIKKVFIMIGVNDIMRGKDVDEIYSNYKKIIEFFKQRGVKIHIQSTLYTGETKAQNFNHKVEDLNRRLEKFAKENRIAFINLNKVLAENKVLKKEFTSDDLHLNGSAYQLWSKEIKKYLN